MLPCNHNQSFALVLYSVNLDWMQNHEQMVVLIYISSLIVIAPLLIFIGRWSRLSAVQKLLGWLIVFTFLIQVPSFALWLQSKNNLPFVHLYTLGEVVLLSLIYWTQFDNKLLKKGVLIVSASLLLFSIINSVFIQSIYTFNSNAATLENCVLIFYSLIYFNQLLRAPELSDLGANPMFWINAGVLVYFSGSLIVFLTSNYLIPKSSDLQSAVWSLHSVINIVHYLIYAIALWVQPKKSPYSIS